MEGVWEYAACISSTFKTCPCTAMTTTRSGLLLCSSLLGAGLGRAHFITQIQSAVGLRRFSSSVAVPAAEDPQAGSCPASVPGQVPMLHPGLRATWLGRRH